MARSKSKTAPFDLNRLCEAIYHSRRDLERFRVERKEAVKQYVGGHWSDEGPPQNVPVNLLSLYTRIISRALISKAPKFLLSTFSRQHKPAVSAMEAWMNFEVQRMGLAQTLARVAVDAIFSVGIAKTSLVDPAHSSLWGWNMGAGTVFCERVDLDDFVFDTHARDFREASFVGHRYRVPLDVVRDDAKTYTARRKDLVASEDRPYNYEGDERINTLQRGAYRQSPEFEEMVDLWEIYLPRHRLVVTLPDDAVLGSAGEVGERKLLDAALRVQDWIGPDEGPYSFLAFGVVPGNAMPKSPIQDLIDLHRVTNELYVKLMRQAENQKTIMAVQGAADTDGNRIINANDGEAIRVDNPEKIKIASYGGADQGNLQFAIHLVDRFSYMAGNMDAMGGLSPQAKTLGQDKMLAESSSLTVSDLQDTMAAFVQEVGRRLGWFWYHDPFKVMRVEHTVNGAPETAIVRKVYPKGAVDGLGRPRLLRRDADWESLDLKVNPYSLAATTPQQQLQKIMTVFTQVVMPMTAAMQQQGVAFDMNKLLQMIAKLMDLPELVDVLTFMEPQTGPEGGDQGDGGMPSATSREYVRRSTGGGTANARQAAVTNQSSPGGGSGMQDLEAGG